ncbi:MAG: hypothetical protein J7K21_01260 [Desulfurococcales archaeon]|nr:hypothetical protein [Desulfurococcales archaeon]
MSGERDVYDIIAGMPLDIDKMDRLADITFEADLLRRSRFVGRRKFGIEEFLKFLESLKKKKALLTAKADSHRYIIYIEDCKLASAAISDYSTGKRIVGLRALSQIVSKLIKEAIVFRVFSIETEKAEEKYEESIFTEKTRQLTAEEREELEALARINIAAYRKRLQSMETTSKHVVREISLDELKKKIKETLEDVLEYKGYKLVDLKVQFDGSKLNIVVNIKRRKLFGVAKVNELVGILKKEIDTLFRLLDTRKAYDLKIKRVK